MPPQTLWSCVWFAAVSSQSSSQPRPRAPWDLILADPLWSQQAWVLHKPCSPRNIIMEWISGQRCLCWHPWRLGYIYRKTPRTENQPIFHVNERRWDVRRFFLHHNILHSVQQIDSLDSCQMNLNYWFPFIRYPTNFMSKSLIMFLVACSKYCICSMYPTTAGLLPPVDAHVKLICLSVNQNQKGYVYALTTNSRLRTKNSRWGEFRAVGSIFVWFMFAFFKLTFKIMLKQK